MNQPAMPHERFEELAAAYVLGALDGDDVRVFEEHLATGCDRCRELFPRLRLVSRTLGLAAEPVQPPPALRARILAAAGVTDAPGVAPGTPDLRTPTPPPRVVDFRRPEPRGRSFWMPLALAALAGLAIMSWQALQMKRARDDARILALESQNKLTGLEDEIKGLRATAAQQAELVRLLSQPESGLVTLSELAPAPGASGKVLWDRKAGKGYLWVGNLPKDAPGKDYQLWAIADGKPVSAGVFSIEQEGGTALVPLDALPSDKTVAVFAITIEPAGGVPSPTGDMVLAGNVGG